jgi:hypothetical protein
MSGVTMKTEVFGIRDAVKTLKKLEPEVFKEFRKEAGTALKPITLEAQSTLNNAGPAPLSGMARKWVYKGRQLFPWSQTKAVRGVKVSLRPSKAAFLSVQQKDAAGAIFDIAGRATTNRFGEALTRRFGRASRGMWPAAEANENEVRRNLADLVAGVAAKTETKLRY